MVLVFFLFQAEDGIRDLVRSRGLGDVYKRQQTNRRRPADGGAGSARKRRAIPGIGGAVTIRYLRCLLYTSDAADERSSVDLGGRRIIKKKNNAECGSGRVRM